MRDDSPKKHVVNQDDKSAARTAMGPSGHLKSIAYAAGACSSAGGMNRSYRLRDIEPFAA
jgi:hypothetical protein